MDVERLERLTDKVGGRFRLTTLLQKRLTELVKGSPAMVDLPSRNYLEIALAEIEEGRIELLTVEQARAQLEAPPEEEEQQEEEEEAAQETE
jgi:DNA-directed RNA polymerase subunit omega